MTRPLVHWYLSRRLVIVLEWKPADLWRGIYIKPRNGARIQHVYICLLPCLPIHVWYAVKGRGHDAS